MHLVLPAGHCRGSDKIIEVDMTQGAMDTESQGLVLSAKGCT